MKLFKEDLDELTARGCGNPECKQKHDVLYMHARCHPKSHADVCYKLGSGEMVVSCMKCSKVIMVVAVAEKIPTTSLSA